jgi:FixJ family two-component response regulator
MTAVRDATSQSPTKRCRARTANPRSDLPTTMTAGASPPADMPATLPIQANDSAPVEPAPAPLVRILDANEITQAALAKLLRARRRQTVAYTSVEDFLAQDDPTRPGCLILDTCLPGRSGVALQDELKRLGRTIPLVFLTEWADVRTSVAAMRGGAVDFLEKPWRDPELLGAVAEAIARDATARVAAADRQAVLERYATLSQRERQVAGMVHDGKLSREIADELGLSEPTIKLHRMWAMRKLRAATPIDFGRIMAVIGRPA